MKKLDEEAIKLVMNDLEHVRYTQGGKFTCYKCKCGYEVEIRKKMLSQLQAQRVRIYCPECGRIIVKFG